MAESDISNLSKFRRLKRYATQTNVSGLVKVSTPKKIWYTMKKIFWYKFQTKKPGVVVFEGEQTAIKSFLENAKGTYVQYLQSNDVIQVKFWWSPGLRYLDFHHLDTKPLSINSNNKIRLADSKPGIHEVENMNELVKALDAIGEKEWFRQQMGMKRQVVWHSDILVFLLLS